MLEEQIKSVLDQEEAAGMSHEKIGKRHNIAASQVTRILRGTRPVSGLTVKTVQKMFPLASFNLNGDGVNAANSGTVHGVVGLNSGTVNTSTPAVASETASAEQIRSRIISALIRLEIPSDALQAVLRTVNDLDLTKQ